MSAKNDVIKVAVKVGEGIAVKATGSPARIIAFGAAAAVATAGTAVGYGAYVGGKILLDKAKAQRASARPTGRASVRVSGRGRKLLR